MPANLCVRHITKPIVCLGLLALLPLTTACAGSAGGAAPPPEPDPAAEFAGVWSGTFEASRFGGDITVEFRLVEGEWTGSTELSVDVESRQAAVENIEIDGNSISFYFFMDGGDVTATATLENGELVGSLEVYVDGNQVDSATFRMTKG
jgi:hypothetical protein